MKDMYLTDIFFKGFEISRGNFGIVYNGYVILPEKTLPAAIKVQLGGMTAQQFKMYLRELKILAYVGDHPNIIQFYGACTANIRKCQVHMVLEFCENGDLLQFLRNHKDDFVNLGNACEVKRVSLISNEQVFFILEIAII